jgi:hypothetical protein
MGKPSIKNWEYIRKVVVQGHEGALGERIDSTGRQLRRDAERLARKEAKEQQKLQSIISRTGRVKAWLNDPARRNPVSCTVFTVEDID